MDKKASPYEQKNGYTDHEMCIDPLLRTLGTVVDYIVENKLHEEFETELNLLESVDFFEKMMGENFAFNEYKSMKKFIRTFCTNNLRLSKKIIAISLKNLNYYSENPFAYLESLKELVLIDDDYKKLRWEFVFGFPTIYESRDFHKKLKFGFQINKNLSLPYLKYKSPLNFISSSNSLLKIIADVHEKSESNCFVFVMYLVDMMNESPDILRLLATFPSPYALFANYTDFVLPFVRSYLEEKKNGYSLVYDSNKNLLYEAAMKDKLLVFENHYRK